MSTNQPYTLSGNEQVEIRIRDHLSVITKCVISKVSKDDIRSLVLLGGYGKGEGGVYLDESGYKPHNNFDLMLITRGLNKNRREQLNNEISASLSVIASNIEVGIDVSVLDQHQLQNMPTRVLWYDMQQGHKTLYGDQTFIKSIRHLKSDIPAWDMRNLMVNRGSLLLINQVCLQVDNRSESIDKLIVKHAMKAIIGYGDSLLYCLGHYHWSYREKHKVLLRHPAIDVAFKRLYDEAMSFRMMPQYQQYLSKDVKKWHREVMEQLERVHLRCEAFRLGRTDIRWDEYIDIALQASLLERGFSLKECARKLRNLMRPKHGKLPSRLSMLNHLAYRMADKETILPIIFPYISFNPPVRADKQQLVTFFTSHFGKQASEPLLNVIKAYLKHWGAAFDRNLNAVLSKNHIAL